MAIPLHAFVTTRFDTRRWPESIPVTGASLVEGHDGFAANILNCRTERQMIALPRPVYVVSPRVSLLVLAHISWR